LGALQDLYDRFADDVAFFIVYIKEAHPEDGWVVTYNRGEDIAIVDPTSSAERNEAAGSCVVKSSVRIPMLVDGLDNAVASAYGGWPDRLYLVGRDGRIAFQGDAGPFGFIPERLEEAITLELRASQPSR